MYDTPDTTAPTVESANPQLDAHYYWFSAGMRCAADLAKDGWNDAFTQVNQKHQAEATSRAIMSKADRIDIREMDAAFVKYFHG